MNGKATLAVLLCVLWFQTVPEVAHGQVAQAPATIGVALDIPGVVKGGTPIERIQTGFDGLDNPIGLTDGTLVFSEPGARQIHGMNTGTNEISVLAAESNESHGVTEDSAGRLISAQAWAGSTRIGVIHPPERVVVLADSFEGRHAAGAAAGAGRLLHPARRTADQDRRPNDPAQRHSGQSRREGSVISATRTVSM